MSAGIVVLLSALSLSAIFGLSCFAQSSSNGSIRTATASANRNMSLFAQPGTATNTVGTSAGDSTSSWQQSTNDVAHNAAAVAEKTYNEVADDMKDISLAARIKAVLYENKSTRDFDVHVTADNGTVILTESVPSEHNAQRVQEVVASLYGIKAVTNHLDYPHTGGIAASRETDSVGIAHPAHSDDASSGNARVY